jgi:hypothetical protein
LYYFLDALQYFISNSIGVAVCLSTLLLLESVILLGAAQGGLGLKKNDRGSVFLKPAFGRGLPTYVIRGITISGKIRLDWLR